LFALLEEEVKVFLVKAWFEVDCEGFAVSIRSKLWTGNIAEELVLLYVFGETQNAHDKKMR